MKSRFFAPAPMILSESIAVYPKRFWLTVFLTVKLKRAHKKLCAFRSLHVGETIEWA